MFFSDHRNSLLQLTKLKLAFNDRREVTQFSVDCVSSQRVNKGWTYNYKHFLTVVLLTLLQKLRNDFFSHSAIRITSLNPNFINRLGNIQQAGNFA